MSDNDERFSRETGIVRAYAHSAKTIMLASAGTLLVLIAFRPEAMSWLTGLAFLLSVVFASLYQYFGLRFLVNLGTRYDLMPIVKRSLLLKAWANRPIIYYVCGMLAFFVGWLSLIWKAL